MAENQPRHRDHSAMDPHAFWIAIASTSLAALSILSQHSRSKSERKTAERHRTEDREMKGREARLALFLDFLQHVESVRQAIGKMASANTMHGMEASAPLWKESLAELQEAKLALQRSLDTLRFLDNARVAQSAADVAYLMQHGIDLAKHPEGITSAFHQWARTADKAEGDLRDVLFLDFAASTRSGRSAPAACG